MLTERERGRAKEAEDGASVHVAGMLQSPHSVEAGVLLQAAGRLTNSAAAVPMNNNSNNNNNQSLFTSVHMTSSTQSDILCLDNFIMENSQQAQGGELMQINEETLSINNDSRLEQYNRLHPRGAKPSQATNDEATKDGNYELLSSRNWNQLDPKFFEQKNCYRTHKPQRSIESVSDRMTAQTGRSRKQPLDDIKRADLFVKGSPTINPDQKHGVIQDHNFTVGPPRQAHQLQQKLASRHRNQLVTQGQARQYGNHKKSTSQSVSSQWNNRVSETQQKKFTLQTAQGIRQHARKLALGLDLPSKHTDDGLDLLQQESDNFQNHPIDNHHERRVKIAKTVRHSMDIMPAKMKAFDLRESGACAKERHTMTKMGTNEKTNFLYESFSRQNIQRSTRFQERNSTLNRSVFGGGKDAIGTSMISHISPRAPQRLLFQSTPLQIFTDLEKIHKKMDEGEIVLQGGRIASSSLSVRTHKGENFLKQQSLSGKAAAILEETVQQANQGWAIYREALACAIAVLPQPSGKDYQLLLQRILDGINDKRDQTEKYIARLHEMYGIEIRTKEQQYADLSKEFESYRAKNNLEEYFAKNLSEESKERVLENVKALMQVTDWGYFDASKVMKLESQNAQSYLMQILFQNEHQQRKKAAEINEQEQKQNVQEGGVDLTPPMTAHAFCTTFDEDLESKVLQRSIEKANNAAFHYLHRTLDKMKRNCGSQTMSIEELFKDYNLQIKEFEKKLKGADQREHNLMNELKRIADMLKDARNSETRWKNMAQEQEEQCENLKYLYSTSDRTIKEQQEQIANVTKSLELSKQAHRRVDNLYSRLQQQEKENRHRIMKLESQIRELGVELDQTTESFYRAKRESSRAGQYTSGVGTGVGVADGRDSQSGLGEGGDTHLNAPSAGQKFKRQDQSVGRKKQSRRRRQSNAGQVASDGASQSPNRGHDEERGEDDGHSRRDGGHRSTDPDERHYQDSNTHRTQHSRESLNELSQSQHQLSGLPTEVRKDRKKEKFNADLDLSNQKGHDRASKKHGGGGKRGAEKDKLVKRVETEYGEDSDGETSGDGSNDQLMSDSQENESPDRRKASKDRQRTKRSKAARDKARDAAGSDPSKSNGTRQTVIQKIEGTTLSNDSDGKGKKGATRPSGSDVSDHTDMMHGAEKEPIGAMRGASQDPSEDGDDPGSRTNQRKSLIQVQKQGIKVSNAKVSDRSGARLQGGVGTQASLDKSVTESLSDTYYESHQTAKGWGNKDGQDDVKSATMKMENEGSQVTIEMGKGVPEKVVIIKSPKTVTTDSPGLASKTAGSPSSSPTTKAIGDLKGFTRKTTIRHTRGLEKASQTTPEFFIIYACELLLQELQKAFLNRKLTRQEKIAQDPIFKGMPVKQATMIAEQIIVVIDRIRMKATNGLIQYGVPAAQLFVNPGADRFVENYQSASVNAPQSWHFKNETPVQVQLKQVSPTAKAKRSRNVKKGSGAGPDFQFQARPDFFLENESQNRVVQDVIISIRNNASEDVARTQYLSSNISNGVQVDSTAIAISRREDDG